jgi:hypothetical protein
LGRCRSRLILIPGTLLLIALALSGGYQITTQGSGSLRFVKGFVHDKQRQLEALSRIIPSNAVVYSTAEDKWLWSQWRVARIDNNDATAASIARASDALPVYVLAPPRRLNVALQRRGFSLVRVDARRGVFRVARR